MIRSSLATVGPRSIWNDARSLVRSIDAELGARAMSQEDTLGSLEVGKLADLIVVDQDVVALAESGRAHEISETQVLLTLFDGKIVFDQ